MSGSEVIILDPIAKPRAVSTRLASRPKDIRGITVGYLDNGWWSFGIFVDHVQKQMVERYGVGGAIHLKKAKSIPATQQIEELSKRCQVVVNGLGN